jgi:GT2 family glycosyltransferase
MQLGIVLVHYHTPELLARAVAALRADIGASGLDAELLVVDNGSDAAARTRISGLDVKCLSPATNLGYAGGVNLGFSNTRAETLVLMNADVEVLPGCLSALTAALEGGAAAAGPRFYWERDKRLMLPPTEERSRRVELLKRLASHGDGTAGWARRRWRRHARRHWLARRPFPSLTLSGALLAVRRDAWQTVGPFDEGFALYFEETDWLRRLHGKRLMACYVPAASAVHRYNQSAAREPRAAQWFAESSRRFENRHYGSWYTALKDRLPDHGISRLTEPPRLGPGVPAIDVGGAGRPEGRVWLEVSPSRMGFPAAAAIVDAESREWRLPSEVWEHLPPGTYYLQIVDDAGNERARCAFERTA